jgi:hypothetical protein
MPDSVFPEDALSLEIQRLRAALRDAIGLLVELRDCPLSEMEQREAEIDAMVEVAERLLPPAE